MKVHHSKHSKKNSSASIVILIVIGLIFSILTACSKEEKAERQDDMKTTDTSKTFQAVNEDKNKIIIGITKEGEVWIEGEKSDLNLIQSKIESLKNKFPDGNITVYKDKDSPSKIVAKVSDLVGADEIINVVTHATKE